MFGKHTGVIFLVLGVILGVITVALFPTNHAKDVGGDYWLLSGLFSLAFLASGLVALIIEYGKKTDPFYWYVALAHRRLLHAKLKDDEFAFVATNMNKHRLVQWINLVAAVCIFLSLREVRTDQLGMVITSLIAPVMVMGAAWFAISFGAIPAHLIECSIEVTFWMYTAFKLSFTTMFLAIGFITPMTLWPVLAVIYIAVDFSCAQYDTSDGLKAGLDDALLRHSRAALLYYQQQGISPEEGEKK